MGSLIEFFKMGGYAIYVWPAFFITFLVLLGNVWFAARQHKQALRDAKRRAAQAAPKATSKAYGS